MFDNHEKRQDSEHIGDDSRAAISTLKKLISEMEEELYSLRTEIKAHASLLKEKELELEEREKIKVHNLDLFSPIHNKASDTKELSLIIDQMRCEMKELNDRQEELLTRIRNLNTVEALLSQEKEVPVEEEINKKSDSGVRLSDKGVYILEAQEMERQRIARDLHDSTVQNLTSLVHKSELCIKLIDIDTIRAKLELNAMSNAIKSVINDMRGFIYNLKPMSLDDLGLTVTTERFANKIMETNDIGVLVTYNEEPGNILPVIKVTLFRIIQEACNNVIKHANASTINIDLNYQYDKIIITIKDDGIGFTMSNQEDVNHSSSFGISIMKERISLLNGSVEIQSEKEKGTTVTVMVPLSKYEEENNE